MATQLQISEARTVFPCIDVPDMKAQFDTVIIHPTGTTSIANMMENSTKVDGFEELDIVSIGTLMFQRMDNYNIPQNTTNVYIPFCIFGF